MSSSLHNHTEYSVLDGFSHPEEYLKRAKELGLHAFAVLNMAINILGYILINSKKNIQK